MLASFIFFFIRKSVGVFGLLSLAASLVELGSALYVASGGKVSSFTSYFSVDALGMILMLIVATIGLMVSWYSISYLNEEKRKEIIGFRRIKQYFILLHLFLAAMFIAIISANPIVMWIAIEATTLSTAFLISFYNKPSAIEAAWKYLIINSVGLLLAFLGTLLFLYPVLGHAGLVNWQTLLGNAASLDPFVAKIAFIFILIGYGTKVGLVPMHTWLPDAHSKAPVPISSLLSGVLLNVAFFAVLRFKAVVDLAIGPYFTGRLLIFFGIISIALAAFIIFGQRNYKRLLAYSSIEHMGLMSLGFGFGGAGAFGALLHMIYHSLTKSLLFLSSGNIFLRYSSTKIEKVRGVLTALPATGIIFFIGFLSITGVPPFGIFLSEFYILSGGIMSHPFLTGLALLALAIVFIGFLKHVTSMLFGKPEEGIEIGKEASGRLAPLLVIVILLAILGFYIPGPLKSLINSAISIY